MCSMSTISLFSLLTTNSDICGFRKRSLNIIPKKAVSKIGKSLTIDDRKMWDVLEGRSPSKPPMANLPLFRDTLGPVRKRRVQLGCREPGLDPLDRQNALLGDDPGDQLQRCEIEHLVLHSDALRRVRPDLVDRP